MLTPEAITVTDHACGSGHIPTLAYDVMTDMISNAAAAPATCRV